MFNRDVEAGDLAISCLDDAVLSGFDRNLFADMGKFEKLNAGAVVCLNKGTEAVGAHVEAALLLRLPVVVLGAERSRDEHLVFLIQI